MNQPEDVEVILSPDKRYQFHSSVLARNSTLFASFLTERNAAKLNKRARNAGIKVRWIIELTKLPDDADPAGRLELVVIAPGPMTLLHNSPHPLPSSCNRSNHAY
jgi:hypothetical protein